METRVIANLSDNLRPLTSLRFFAAMMIVMLHSTGTFGWTLPLAQEVALVHGVSFFFVLSGFILTHVYHSRGAPKLTQFMRARYARLWPVHLSATVFLVAFVAADSITFDGPGIFNKWIVLLFNLGLVHSLAPVLSYTFSWNSVSWSISTEIFFYLAFPLLLVDIERTWAWKLLGSALLAGSVIGALAFFEVPIQSENVNQVTATFATYPSPLVRGFEFALGMATFALWKRHLRKAQLSTGVWSILELSVLLFCAWWLADGFFILRRAFTNPYANLFIGPAGSCWVFAILIATLAAGRGALGVALSSRPLVYLGEISFSIYMFHMILIKVFVTTLNWRDVPAIIYLMTLLALASVSYLAIEKPGQRLLSGGQWRRRHAANLKHP